MNIISGLYRGQKLTSPKSFKTRPTAAKIRAAIFDILNHADWCEALEGARVIDIFSGSGALGLEALSQKAGFCLFIDYSFEAIQAVRQNIHRLDVFNKTRVYRRDALSLGKRPGGMLAFNLAFIDPPYYQNYAEKILRLLLQKDWLMEDMICVVETGKDEALNLSNCQSALSTQPFLKSYELKDKRIYGAACIWFLQVKTVSEEDNRNGSGLIK